MRADILAKPLNSTMLSCEKDMQTILRRLFVESKQHGKMLKRLLVCNTKDCMDIDASKSAVIKKAEDMSLVDLKNNGYIRLIPKIEMPEHEEIKTYILIDFDNFTLNSSNPLFKDSIISFDIICHTDYWDLGDFRLRPLKIAGIIDGILDNCKLSGIGELHFMGCNKLVLNQDLSGYTLMYQRINGSDDKIDGQ